MKKFLAILCLVLAMIMVCGVALASGTDEDPNTGNDPATTGDTMHEVNAEGTAWVHVYPTDPAEGKVLTINGVKIIRFYCEKTD